MVIDPVFCTIMKQISDGHQYFDELFAARADFKVIIDKARKQVHQEFLHNTLGSLGAKPLIAATAWEFWSDRQVGTTFGPDYCQFHTERIAEREALHNLF